MTRRRWRLDAEGHYLLLLAVVLPLVVIGLAMLIIAVS